MTNEKKYFNIKEVSNILNLKEHVIRHWDSIDPKTKSLRIDGLSMRTKGGTRYFNKNHINKLSIIKNILFEEGKHNYSLDLVKKILSSKKLEKQFIDENNTSDNQKNIDLNKNTVKLKKIIKNLKILIS
tara:strand:+ start:4633 stop:5019 length:387 start_codon:yes stop_codon:yes gene_type:complete